MDPPIKIRPSFPHSQSLQSGSFHKPLILLHQSADRLKTTITENQPIWSHAPQPCLTQWNYEPCRVWPPKTGHGGEFWENVVHWRRQWQTTSVFLPWEPHEQYEKAKRYNTERWTPRLVGVQYATRHQWRNSSRKNEEMEPKQKQHPIMDVTGDGSKVWYCKEQYYIRTWNVRPMNQDKLEVVKQEMARVNINIWGISELKWTRMGEFNSDDHCIYCCGQESLRRNGVAFIVNKSLKCSTWVKSKK